MFSNETTIHGLSLEKTKRLAVLGIAVLTFSVSGCNRQNEDSGEDAPSVAVTNSLVVASPDIYVQDSVPVSKDDKDFYPYRVTIDEGASKALKSEFRQDPCEAILGDYAGRIACEVRGKSVLIASLPGE